MCHLCDYEKLLSDVGLDITGNRLRVLEVVGNNNYPVSADDVYRTISRTDDINRVTVYRILGLLEGKRVIDRLSTSGKSFYYGLAPNSHHQPHAHFYCKSCGRMDCLSPESINVDTSPLGKIMPGRIDKVEIRIDGICGNCLRNN